MRWEGDTPGKLKKPLVNKNAIKPKIGDPRPLVILSEKH
jgi:hypothetical protein